MHQQAAIRRTEPIASDWQHFASEDGSFDTGSRAYTPLVEGTIRIPQILLLATLQGGAARLEVNSECGHRYSGPERAGMISIVPSNCERRLRLYGVSSRWASVAFDADLIARVIDAHEGRGARDPHCISNVEDAFLSAALCELARTILEDGVIERMYFEAMLHGLAHHLTRRHLQSQERAVHHKLALARWQLNRIAEFVDAHLETPIRVSDLAALAGLSEGYFHRAFRRAIGATPLEFINRKRIERARQILREEPQASIIDVALRVGYTSPNYFARTFRKYVGINPSELRRRA